MCLTDHSGYPQHVYRSINPFVQPFTTSVEEVRSRASGLLALPSASGYFWAPSSCKRPIDTHIITIQFALTISEKSRL